MMHRSLKNYFASPSFLAFFFFSFLAFLSFLVSAGAAAGVAAGAEDATVSDEVATVSARAGATRDKTRADDKRLGINFITVLPMSGSLPTD